MKKIIFVLVLIPFLFACQTSSKSTEVLYANFQNPEYQRFLDTRPDQGRALFLAVSSRLMDREQEEYQALIHAASQVSIYDSVHVFARSGTKKTSYSQTDIFVEEVNVDYNKSQLEQIAPELTIIEKIQDSEGTYLIVEYDQINLPSFQFQPRYQDGSPTWIFEPPVIDGYYVSIGVAQRSRFIGKSILQADEMALMEMAKQISIEIQSKQISVDLDGQTGIKTANYHISEVDISGFYILSRGISPDGNYYYSLGILKK